MRTPKTFLNNNLTWDRFSKDNLTEKVGSLDTSSWHTSEYNQIILNRSYSFVRLINNHAFSDFI